MSVKVSALVWEQGPPDRNQRFVMLAIADNANDEGYAFPLVATIASKCLMTSRNVLRVIKMLVDDGWVSIEVSPKNYRANAYQIDIQKLSCDKLSRDKKTPLGDKSGTSQVTKSTVSGDIPGILILSNVNNGKEPSENTALPAGQRDDVPKLDPEVQSAKAAKWKRVIDLIDVQYKRANPGIPVPWSSLGFARLKKLLETVPAWGEAEWGRCIDNRYQSDAIIKGDPPEVFIPHLKSYISGPLTQFGKAKEKSNGSQSVPTRTQHNRNAVTAVHERIDRAAAQGDSFGGGSYGGGDGD